ncbi:uncharacterized protein LOC108052336 [Drosophila rhopaloa]|uniref:Uncharacterized protein n=2 Tax=Drosophila rhopaloa TaxID=1041015 RepID=A0ABM5JC58_DRORH|nr:uncharacterized protein LOC108052336 [Drosophila rhopaloa]
MALVAHRMMLPARHRRSTTQQVARNKVGVLLVPSVADYYAGEIPPPPGAATPTPAGSQMHLPQDPAETAADGSNGKVSATSRCNGRIHLPLHAKFPLGISPKSSFVFTLFLSLRLNLEPAAYVEIRNESQSHFSTMDNLEKPNGGRENEIIRQAAKEHEIVKQQRFLEITRREPMKFGGSSCFKMQ